VETHTAEIAKDNESSSCFSVVKLRRHHPKRNPQATCPSPTTADISNDAVEYEVNGFSIAGTVGAVTYLIQWAATQMKTVMGTGHSIMDDIPTW